MTELYDGDYVDLTIWGVAELSGTATGLVHVRERGRLKLTGKAHHLRIERGGEVTILGTVFGDAESWGRMEVEYGGRFEGMVTVHTGILAGVPREQIVSLPPSLEDEVRGAQLIAAQNGQRRSPLLRVRSMFELLRGR